MSLRIGHRGKTVPNSRFSWQRWWESQSECYEFWKITGSGNLVGLKRGDILTVGGTAGSYTFQVPNTAAYIALDIDNIWFKTDESQRTATEAEMVGYDFSRTIVKYLDVAPYSIEYIMILASAPATAKENKMRDDFHLSFWWSNVLSLHGSTKGNCLSEQSVFLTEPNMPSGLTLSLISGGMKIDFTDNSGGLAQHEVWCRNDSDEYTTVTYTLNAGTVTKSETINPVDLRYCKIRAKNATGYSSFTEEESIAMLGPELITNGTFDSATGWTLQGPYWTISGGKLNYVGGGTKYASINVTGYSGSKYRVKFTISDRVSDTKMRILAKAGTGIFATSPGGAVYLDFANGGYTLYPVASANFSDAAFWSNTGGAFKIDNYSLKIVL
jgi:hypothetical protein